MGDFDIKFVFIFVVIVNVFCDVYFWFIEYGFGVVEIFEVFLEKF